MNGADGASLRFRQLEVGYGGRRVAGPFDGCLQSGQLSLITGSNGTGKTTLLRTLLGLLPPLGGVIERPEGLTCSYVPHSGAQDPGFPVTCAEVVATGLPLKAPRRQRRDRSLTALHAVGLAALAERSFHQLSCGQRQRVLVARSLCAEAQLIALDEPTAGVDADSSEAVWETLRGLADEGRIVVAITHDHFLAPRFADQQLVIDGGRLHTQAPRSLLEPQAGS